MLPRGPAVSRHEGRPEAHLPRTLHNLYLRLLTNSDFKHAFAERYTAN